MAEKRVANPVTLREAVQEVIRQNVSVGYNPRDFIEVTESGYAEDLVTRCTSLVNSPEALSWVFRGVETHSEFLALEDLIVLSIHGREWGFDDATVMEANDRSEAFNSTRRACGYTVWVADRGINSRGY